MDYFLKQVDPGNPHPLLISLHENEMKIGRSTITSLSRYNRVSRYHASLTKLNNCWILKDLGSLNSLYVNFKQVQQSVQLNIGDIIGFGSPNISQDGGFVCVLTVRNKVIVKQELLDDDCVEIPVQVPAVNTICSTNISTVIESSVKYNTHSDLAALKYKSDVLGSTSSSGPNTCVPKNCKEGLTFDHNQNIDNFSKLPSSQSKPIVEDSSSVTRKDGNLERTTLALSSEVHKLIPVNPVVIGTAHNISKTKSFTETTIYDLNGRKINSEIVEYNVDNDQANSHVIATQCPQMSAYPGIEYFEGVSNVMENTSCKKQVDVNTSCLLNLNPVQVKSIETVSNLCNVKQETHSDLVLNVSEDNNAAVSGSAASVGNRTLNTPVNEVQNYNNVRKFVDAKSISNDSVFNAINPFSNLLVPNNLMKLKKIPVTHPSLPSSNFSTASFTEKTCNKNIAVNNVPLNHYNEANVKQEKHLNLNKNLSNELFNANSKEKPHHNCTENGQVDSQYPATQLRELLVNFEIEKNVNCSTKRLQGCSIPLIRCDSINSQRLLNTAEKSKVVSSEKEKSRKEIDNECYAKNSTKVATHLKNAITATPSKADFSNLTNLKVKSSKILNPVAGSILNPLEEKNTYSNPTRETSTKANIKNSKTPTEQFSNNFSKNLNQQKEPMTEIPITMAKPLQSNRNKMDNVKKCKMSNADVPLELYTSKQETKRPQKKLDDAASDYQHNPPRLTLPVKRKQDTKRKHSPKRIKTKETEENCFSSNSHSEVLNSFFIDQKKTIGSNKTAIVSNVVNSKKLHVNECSPLKSPHEAVNEKTNAIPHPIGSKSMGKTILIDYKPMEYRRRTRRGGEEGFQEGPKGVVESNNCFGTSLDTSCFRDDWRENMFNVVSLKNVETAIVNSKEQNIENCQKKKEKEVQLKCHQISEERTDPQKKLVESSNGNLKMDTHASEKPSVPNRENSFSSHIGFKINVSAKPKKSAYCYKQQTDILMQDKTNRHSLTTYPSSMPPKSKMKLDIPVNDKVPNKHQEMTTKRNSTQTSTKSRANYSNTVEQYSKGNQKSTLTDQIFGAKNVSSLDKDYRFKHDTVYEQRKGLIENMIISENISNSSKQRTISNKTDQFTHFNSSFPKKVAIISPVHKTVDETPKSQSSAVESKCLKASSTLLVEMIVGWNPKWLEEQKNNKSPPPHITKNATYLNFSYSSYESYASSYFPMIVLEVWEHLFRESKPFLEQLQNWNNFCFTIKSWENKHRLTELKCESVVSDILCYHPGEGKIILLNILDREEYGIKNYVFGCIRRHSIVDFKRGAQEWKHLPADALNNAKLVKFELSIKKIKRPMQLKSVYLAHGLVNIMDKMQLADALHSFRDSPLCKDVYHPREESFMFCDSSRKQLSMVNLIQAVSEEVQNHKSKSRVIFINAPSGTGKTELAVNLVKKLTNDNYVKTKILVCTPSQTSLDEVLLRLINSGNTCGISIDSVKFVRLGEHERIEEKDSKLKEYSLLSKVEKLYREDCAKKMNRRECELKILEEKINDLLFKQCNDSGKYKKINKDSTLQILIKKMSSVKKKNLLHPMDEGFRKGYECLVLKESDVLLSTLESSMQPAARTFLKEKNLAYCIVDDATQCNELQLLQCLQHPQIAKLILLGDAKQMSPTILSSYATEYGFDRSTMERFCLHYKKKYKKIPSSFLKEQHRMHSEICHFPSKYFYNQELQTAPSTDTRFPRFPLKPYNVIDILDSGPISDETISSLIVYICSILVQTAPKASVGVIVDKLGFSLPCEYDVEVNTLESLQGREKDIVLIPCIRPFAPSNDFLSCEKSLNVAITRAKQCLIICGRISSQVQFPHWKALMDDAMDRNRYLCVASIKHIPLVFTNFIKKGH